MCLDKGKMTGWSLTSDMISLQLVQNKKYFLVLHNCIIIPDSDQGLFHKDL